MSAGHEGVASRDWDAPPSSLPACEAANPFGLNQAVKPHGLASRAGKDEGGVEASIALTLRKD